MALSFVNGDRIILDGRVALGLVDGDRIVLHGTLGLVDGERIVLHGTLGLVDGDRIVFHGTLGLIDGDRIVLHGGTRLGKGIRLLDVRELTTQETFLFPLAFGAGAAQVPAHIAAIKIEALNFIVVGRTAETQM